jgi:hypothetical protein
MTLANYDAAVEFVRNSATPARIVSDNPFESCVPLDALRTLSLVHASPAGSVRIFEFSGGANLSLGPRVGLR